MAKAKTINLLLNDGSLNGVISMEDSSLNKGELYSAPRESVEDLVSTDVCSRYGVYLLLSEDMVYIGQASDLARRIKQHIIGKSWWERVVILTTSDDSLNRADLDYIESVLIAKASSVGRLDCDNKNVGNKQKLSKFREVEIQQYLEEALFLLELIGINVFKPTQQKSHVTASSKLIPTVANTTESQRAIREKKEAISFLEAKGIVIGKQTNYAKRGDTKAEYWINPQRTVVDKDWYLVLNNQFKCELTVLHIPANSFVIGADNCEGLIVRGDNPSRIELNISDETLIDRTSKCSFKEYEIARINY
jgi:hypothetical protein